MLLRNILFAKDVTCHVFGKQNVPLFFIYSRDFLIKLTTIFFSYDLPELLMALNHKFNKSKYENRSSTTDSVYPFYDSEMVDNIGHRSRVLLSIQEENTTESARRISIDNKEVIGENFNVTGTGRYVDDD